MPVKPLVYRHYQRALAQWPVDILRPHVSFQNVMRRRIDRELGPLEPNKPASDPSKEKKETPVQPLKVYHENEELEQVNVLYSLLENRYTNKYPLSDKLMKPLSDPDHYTKLVMELEEAPKRSWFGRLINRWKGAVRFS